MVLRRFAAVLLAALCTAGSSYAATVAAPPANGIESGSADAIVAAALAAGTGAGSVHVHGSGFSNGGRIALDMRLGAHGGRGHLEANGLSFDVIRTGGTAYFKAGVEFWRKAGGPSFAPLAPLFAGKWMKASATKGDLASLTPLTDLRALLRAILTSHGKLVKAGTATLGGQRVVAVRDTTQGGTLYVAATGKPYPLELAKGGASGGAIMFDHWGAPVSLAAPRGAVDLSRYGKH